jgi:large subunit ribosomal protein L21
MFAVIRTGGKQYRVTENARIQVERLPGNPGDAVELNDVLMLGGDGGASVVGTPLVGGAAVFAQVIEQKRGPKLLVFKKRRRKNFRRLRGHRQDLTVLRITGISADGTPPAALATAVADAPSLPAPPAEAAADAATEE